MRKFIENNEPIKTEGAVFFDSFSTIIFENLDLILKKLVNSKFISNKTLIILHRHKKTKDSFIKEFKIVREEIYGSSKIFFGFFNF